jgi:ribosomal protein S18 acetylase RimI-like enzyme
MGITRKNETKETSSDVLDSNAVFISVWQRFAENFQNADITTRDGLVICWPDVPLSVYNNIFFFGRIDDSETLAARAREAASFASRKRELALITLCHELLPPLAQSNLDVILSREGYARAMALTGMSGDILPLEAHGHHDLHIERAENDGVVVTDLNCMAYGIPLKSGRASLLRPSFWQSAFSYVAFEKQHAVATATTIVHGECLYLALVATIPEAQRKGYAEAVVRHSLQRAHEATGTTRTMLHATDAGFPLYKRLAYQAVAHFTSYLAKPDPNR